MKIREMQNRFILIKYQLLFMINYNIISPGFDSLIEYIDKLIRCFECDEKDKEEDMNNEDAYRIITRTL